MELKEREKEELMKKPELQKLIQDEESETGQVTNESVTNSKLYCPRGLQSITTLTNNVPEGPEKLAITYFCYSY